MAAGTVHPDHITDHLQVIQVQPDLQILRFWIQKLLLIGIIFLLIRIIFLLIRLIFRIFGIS